jgi:hypothetical protein
MKRQFQTNSLTPEIIPEKILLLLPFVAEPISEWNESTDLLEFLYSLSDKEFTSISDTGEKYSGTYRSYGKHIFDTGLSRFKNTIIDFERVARSSSLAPASALKEIIVPEFNTSSEYGLMAKYSVAWDGLISEILSENAFFSLPHILESDSDLNCSILLASNLYYKQAFQVLRGFLESLVLSLYFLNNVQYYKNWKEDSFRTPSLRGKNGVVKNLLSNNQISSSLAEEISSLYGTFNQFIHSSESKLIHKGVFTGQWNGMVFQSSEFNGWCEAYAKTVEVGIKLTAKTIATWSINRSTHKDPFCSVCHNHEEFKVEYGEFAGNPYVSYHCSICGSSYTKQR